jgi:very-short-patch-repair endonuclease
MDPVEALRGLGGVARRRVLLRVTSRKRLHGAVLRGEIARTSRGVYRLAAADLALVRAAELRGAASYLSAATLHGWEVAFPATCPWITVPRNVGVSGQDDCFVFWADLSEEEGPVTSPLRTVIDCARRLEFGPALAVADSALRHGDVTHAELVDAAAAVRGKGAARAGRVASQASPLAANPFESMLRAIAIEAGLSVRPQVGISLGEDEVVHPDVVDRERRVVLEADSWEFHAGKEAHARDCRRYTLLVVHGWTVLRFTWRQVMHDPDFVRWCLDSLVRGKPHGANVA